MVSDLLPAAAPIAHLVNEHLKRIGIAPEKQQEFQYTELLADFLNNVEKTSSICCRESGFEVEVDHKLHKAIEVAHKLISRFHYICHRDFSIKTPEQYRTIWKHRDLETAFYVGFTSEESCKGYRSEIAELADMYLNQDLRSPKFEVLIVDALVASEVYDYGELLKKHPSRFLTPQGDFITPILEELKDYNTAQGNFEKLGNIWREKALEKALKRSLIRVGFLYVVPILIAWLAARYKFDVIAFLSAAFVGLLVVRELLYWVLKGVRSIFQVPQAPQKTSFQKALELHSNMVLAYQELRAGTSSSPKRVREVLAKVADEGAAWEPAIFSLLDASIARSHGNWG